jgi:hypothetical protein
MLSDRREREQPWRVNKPMIRDARSIFWTEMRQRALLTM